MYLDFLKNDIKIFEKMFLLYFLDYIIRSFLFNVSLLLLKCREVFFIDEL